MSSLAPPAVEVYGPGIGQPATFAFNITPSDTVELQMVTRAIRVGTGGDLAIKTVGGSVVIIPDLQDGETIVVRAVLVYATDTAATGLVGLV